MLDWASDGPYRYFMGTFIGAQRAAGVLEGDVAPRPEVLCRPRSRSSGSPPTNVTV
jgi:hypothetical protein